MTATVGQPDAVVDGVDVDAVAAAVRACPGVLDLTAGWMGGRATYLPGRRIEGVAVDADAVVVQVRGRWEVTARELAGQIRAAVAPLAAGRRVDVVLADLDKPLPTEADTRPDGYPNPPGPGPAARPG